MHDDLQVVRSIWVNFHVLRDAGGLYLIDGGFAGGRLLLRRALHENGWENEPIVGIIVTHGHLDHILNVAKIAAETGAWIAAPRLDAAHYEGRPSYQGPARVTGCLEALGRMVFRFRPFEPHRLLDEGDEIDVWGGLRVIHLPGHTAGHCGFYSEARKLLFCGDLFASCGALSHFPPAIFNSDGAQIAASVKKALKLDLDAVFPNHADRAAGAIHLQRLKEATDR